jgi:acid phosphatase
MSGPGSMCPLSDFADFVDKRGAAVGNFIHMCGLENVTNATDSVPFFENIPANSTIVMPLP